MKKFCNLFLSLIAIFFICACSKTVKEDVIIINLDTNWYFKHYDSTNIWQGKPPSSVHADLFYDTIIKEPFINDNNKDLQWISNSTWEYKSSFKMNSETLNKEEVVLILEGIDTYADIYINDSLVLKTDNMFMRWNIECKRFLKRGSNILKILLFPTDNKETELKKLYNIAEGEKKIITRCNSLIFGGLFSSKLTTCGVWKTIYLKAYDKFYIENINISQTEITDTAAYLSAKIHFKSAVSEETEIIVQCNDSIFHDSRFELYGGENMCDIILKIKNPRLWWCNTMGESYLYNLKFNFLINNNIIDTFSCNIGLRKIEIKLDSANNFAAFFLNNVPVFLKAASFFNPIVYGKKEDFNNIRTYVDYAKEMNLNMLRIDGAGIYQTREFYDYCDSRGILVWQDIPMSNAILLNNQAMIKNYEAEVTQNIQLLYNHPSFAILNADFLTQTDNDVINIYDNSFKNMVSLFGNNFCYLSQKTKAEMEIKNEELDLYQGNEKIISKIGILAMPEMKSIEKFIRLDKVDSVFSSEEFLAHLYFYPNYTPFYNNFIKHYSLSSFLKSIIYKSQLIQAEMLSREYEQQKIDNKNLSGIIFYSLNEPTQTISPSVIDFYGEWKAAAYYLKRKFNEIDILIKEQNNTIKIFVNSCKSDNQEVEVMLRVANFKGKSVWKERKKINILANQTAEYLSYPKTSITGGSPLNSIVLVIRLIKQDLILAEKYYYFVKTKELNLQAPSISTDILKIDNGYAIEFKTNYLAKDIFVQTLERGHLEDNYFDLLPGESKFVKFATKNTIEDFKSKLSISSFWGY